MTPLTTSSSLEDWLDSQASRINRARVSESRRFEEHMKFIWEFLDELFDDLRVIYSHRVKALNYPVIVMSNDKAEICLAIDSDLEAWAVSVRPRPVDETLRTTINAASIMGDVREVMWERFFPFIPQEWRYQPFHAVSGEPNFSVMLRNEHWLAIFLWSLLEHINC